jgi:asparagine synthase (glutamine-hydrolysing)
MRAMKLVAGDPLGLEPLYLYQRGTKIDFSHDIRAAVSNLDTPAKPNEWAIQEYVRKGRQDHTEQTFFVGVLRVPPGQEVTIGPNGKSKMRTYWEPPLSSQVKRHDTDYTKFREMFFEAIQAQLPRHGQLAVSLSGGIDSCSILAGLFTLCPSREIETFSVVYPDWKRVDESAYIKLMSDYIPTKHHSVLPTPEGFWNDLPELVRCQGEPFSSPSAYSDWMMMKCVHEVGGKVLMGGIGSDAVLCGEPRYLLYYLMALLNRRKYSRLIAETARNFGPLATLLAQNGTDFVRYGGTIAPDFFKRLRADSNVRATEARDPLTDKMRADITRNVLPSELRCLYRNSHWFNVDTRSPFLHLPFFEYLASLPVEMKLSRGWRKYALRQAMKGLLPEQIRLRRDKIGFGTPTKEWFSGPLRSRLMSFFSEPLNALKHYDIERVRALLNSDRPLSEFESSQIWRILNVEVWFKEFFAN